MALIQGKQIDPSVLRPVPVRVNAEIGSAIDADSLDALEYRSVKWLLTITDLTNGKYRVGEVLAFHDGVGAKHTHYAIIGDVVLYEVDVVLSGNTMILRVTNQDSVELVVDTVRVGTIPI